jgi:hypothetical protein
VLRCWVVGWHVTAAVAALDQQLTGGQTHAIDLACPAVWVELTRERGYSLYYLHISS